MCLFSSLLQAFPHIALIIVMLFFIYAVIGMQVSFSKRPMHASPLKLSFS